MIPFFLAAWFGMTAETDAFFFVYGLILFFSAILARVIESVVVPYIAELRNANEDVGLFVGNVLGICTIALIVIVAGMLLIIRPVLAAVTRFDADNLELVYRLLMITAPMVILLVLTSVLAGTLNAYKRFTLPAIGPAFRAVVAILLIYLMKEEWGVYAIAAGYVAGEFVRLIAFLFAVVQMSDLRLRLTLRTNPKVTDFLKTGSYQMIGMAAIGLNPVVDKTMASWLSEGSVSVLHYADRLYMIPLTLMTTGLMVTLLSHWSGRYCVSGFERLNKDLRKTLRIVGFSSFILMVFLIVLHRPIVRLAFGRGEFGREMLSQVGLVWICYLLGIAFYAMKQVYVRAYLTLKKTKVLMQCAFIMVVLNAVFNYVFMSYYDVVGIALATTLVSFITLLFFHGVFRYIARSCNRGKP